MARLRAWPAVVVVVLGLVAAPTAQAFDTGPHADLTVDALRAEGFGADAADVGQINNWFVDLYSQAGNNPFSGHGTWYATLLGGAAFNSEDWSQGVLDAVSRLHFDSPAAEVADTAGIEREWGRLRRAVHQMLQGAKARRDPLEVLMIIGASLHPLQDFYSHTNFIEPAGTGIFEAPGWEGRGQGRTPTWFDVAKAARDATKIYSAGATGITRTHGGWKDPPEKSMAKDWPGRPHHTEAFMASAFASRQWIRAVRTWLADEPLWAAAQRYSQNTRALAYDVEGALDMSTYVGHWSGQGGPCTPGCDDTSGAGGSLVALRSVTKAYFEDRGRTIFRRTFERLIERMAVRDPVAVPEQLIAVESSRPLQAATRFVRLQIPYMRGYELGDVGPDDADLFARATIAGQRFVSPIIQAHDSFSFSGAYHPFTFIKSVPADGRYSEPITDITVRLRTGTERLSGTDDDVYLRLGPNLRFPLDKRVYDDFERGDDDTYSVPIDAAARAGLSLGDIAYVQIEKSRDGVAGGWRLRGVTVRVNGRTLSDTGNVDRWLEDDRRTWRAPDVPRDHRTGNALGVWFDLREDDLRIYGFDDQGDINPYDARDAIVRAYLPGTTEDRQTTGGHTLGGRLGAGGDKAALRYQIDTLTPVLPPGPVFARDAAG